MKLEKEKGKTAYCPTCKALMFCNEVPATDKYPAKLQWQNQDNTAHYNYDYKTKEVTCKSIESTERDHLPPQTDDNQQKLENVVVASQFRVKEIDMNDLAVKAQLRHFESDMSDFEMFETFIFNRYGNINPAKAGMIIKFLEERRRDRTPKE